MSLPRQDKHPRRVQRTDFQAATSFTMPGNGITGSVSSSPSVDYRTVMVQRTIRSGQSVHYTGNIVVMGDVNPGAEVVAGGNIVVMGYLRGVAHAGATGNEKAIVAAFRLHPTQLRIANHITRAPDGEEDKPEQPEVARIVNGTVVIERYQSNTARHLVF